MYNRVWDPQHQYTEGFLKEYQHWVLEVSYRQHTLGCYILFAKDHVERISQLSPDAMVELRTAMKDIEDALTANPLFRPDRFNYWQMGNNLPHLHFHGIPRYASPRHFEGEEWFDQTWGSVPVWSKQNRGHDLVRKLREAIKQNLIIYT